ncbi:MAG TPA: hypothetical protein PL029_00660 [Bacteroidia bacterium]|nr:hypothetical protein [Bacteroidia bacterium]
MRVQQNIVHPEDNNNVNYWTKKWGVSIRQFNDAILDTGSLNPVRLKEHLKKNNWYHSFIFGLNKLLRNGNMSIH